MRILYIAPYSEGSTSKMRGGYLRKLLNASEFQVIDTQQPVNDTSRVFRTIGWRFKKGPLINNVNRFIGNQLDNSSIYDLTWIDKGVFIEPRMIRFLKQRSGKIVHFTPDPAFTYHKSALFNEAVPLYDHCITTKSYEIGLYQSFGVDPILCSQGYDPSIHKPYYDFADKDGVVFIGHHEDEREEVLSQLVESGAKVSLAGIKWSKFCRRYKSRSNLIYKGSGVFGEAYAREISKARIGLGLLSKWVPEEHTTRTFEIPACRTALVTEKTVEISSFYDESEVVYFADTRDLVQKTLALLKDNELLHSITEKGYRKVLEGRYSYEGILQKVLHQIYKN